MLILASFGNFSIISALTVATQKVLGSDFKKLCLFVLDRTQIMVNMYVKRQNAGITKMNEAPNSNESVRIGTQV